MKYYRSLAIIFSIGALLIASSIVMTFLAGQQVIKAREGLHAHMSAVRRLDDFLLTMTTAETGQRGYLLTGNEAYLKPYQDAEPQIAQEMRDLDQNKLFPKETVRLLEQRSKQKLTELAATIALRRTQGAATALARVQTNVGQNLMDEIRKLILDTRNSQQAAIQEATVRDERLTQMRTVVFILIGLANLGFLAWAYVHIARDRER